MTKPADLVLEQKEILEQTIVVACNQFMQNTGLALTGVEVKFADMTKIGERTTVTVVNGVKISFTV